MNDLPFPKVAQPDHLDSRICFCIAYYKSEKDAEIVGAHYRESGYTYNGGLFHGMKCGREKSRDYVKDGVQYFAVTR